MDVENILSRYIWAQQLTSATLNNSSVFSRFQPHLKTLHTPTGAFIHFAWLDLFSSLCGSVRSVLDISNMCVCVCICIILAACNVYDCSLCASCPQGSMALNTPRGQVSCHGHSGGGDAWRLRQVPQKNNGLSRGVSIFVTVTCTYTTYTHSLTPTNTRTQTKPEPHLNKHAYLL